VSASRLPSRERKHVTREGTFTADYSSSYSQATFWAKCKSGMRKAGREVLEKALWLYYAMQKDDCPAWAKATIVGALGYFIFPIDAIPDVLPVVGYSDDLAVLAGAVAAVASQIDGNVREAAMTKLNDWGLA
jgi:uncharacterized membrane protein YkvA (DUF1232 family)